MKKSIALILSLLATSLLAACGSSDTNAGSSNCSSPPPMDSSASAECLSCVKDACGTQYSNFCSGNCGANASSSSCQQAASDIGSCVIEHCGSECDTGVDNTAGSSSGGATSQGGSSSNGGRSSAGGASSAGSGGAGTPTTPNCVKLEECCGKLPGEQVQGPCYQSAGYNNDGPCANLLTAYQNAGQCKANTDVNVTCLTDKTCNKQSVPPSIVETYKSACTDSGGTVVDVCPTEGVAGCCTIQTAEICSYDADAPLSEEQCTMMGGKYSAKP